MVFSVGQTVRCEAPWVSGGFHVVSGEVVAVYSLVDPIIYDVLPLEAIDASGATVHPPSIVQWFFEEELS